MFLFIVNATNIFLLNLNNGVAKLALEKPKTKKYIVILSWAQLGIEIELWIDELLK
jgi:hypothetical protein